MKKNILMIILVLFCQNIYSQPSEQINPDKKNDKDKRTAWWRGARFGMFIHWGIYSVPAGLYDGKESCAEWIMDCSKIPIPIYEKYTKQFNPKKFNAKEWVKTAKDAGMKYIVITSKHHDGFSMWGSKVSPYNIVDATPYKIDVMKELAEACKDAGIVFCFYHSIMDWHHPLAKGNDFAKYREEYLKPQLKELLTGYGPLGVLWFDGEWIGEWTEEQGKDLYKFVRSFQPNIIINNRVGKGRSGMAGMNKTEEDAGDFGTPEQEVPPEGFPGVDWESCMTLNDDWGYKARDTNWKSTKKIIELLVETASKGGNLLLNVGPTSEGIIPQPSVDRLKEVGEWMKINGEAIYGSKSFRTSQEGNEIRYTQSSDNKYLYCIYFGKLKNKIELISTSIIKNSKIKLLGFDQDINYKLLSSGIELEIPENIIKKPPSNIAVVFKMELKSYVETPKIILVKDFSIDEPVKVTIIRKTDASNVFYTVDGTIPTEKSIKYEKPFVINKNCTINAKAFKSGLSESLISKADIIILNAKENGLNYKLYEGKWDSLPNYSTLKPVKSGSVYDFDLKYGKIKEDEFGIVYDGFIDIDKDGEYTFYTKSDDGSKLFINNVEIVNNDFLHGTMEKSGKVTLKKGKQKIRVEFFEKDGNDSLEILYESTGIEKQKIPLTKLFRR